ncbi:MAG: FAD-dependent oxidoreductase [Lentisphaerae bacterium]|nr:FAD-dependent oxidoreductase [Lentisphaerota bacterium]
MEKYCFDKEYDVAVVGAGVAGVAAAVAAARRGRKTVLIEKQSLIGGLATSGLIFIYLPLCDGNGRQLISGISEEMLKKSCEFGPFDVSLRWGGTSRRNHRPSNRYEVEFSPAGFTLSLDEMLEDANVDLWLDSRVCDCVLQGDRISAVEVENTTGRGIVRAGCFVDASGEALLIRRAGGKVYYTENSQTMWAIETAPDASCYHFTGDLHINPFKFTDPEVPAGDAVDGKTVTAFTRTAWKHLREYYRANYASGKVACHENYPVHLPAMPQFRKIAAISGKTTLDTQDCFKHFDDSIGLTGDWRAADFAWETPFAALLPEKIDGVFAAGRCMAAIGDAWEVYRVIPTAAMTGEAAGIAAAIASEKGCKASEVNASEVQSALRKLNVKLHLEEVGLSSKA